MATLFEYVKEIDEIIANATDEDGVINDELLTAKLDELEIKRDEKIDNCINFFKSRRAMSEALKNEKLAIAKRQQVAENEAERMKNYLAYCLGGSKWESVAGKISYRKSVVVDVDDDFSDERFITYEPKVSKTDIKEALKRGEDVSGARLVEKQNVQIA